MALVTVLHGCYVYDPSCYTIVLCYCTQLLLQHAAGDILHHGCYMYQYYTTAFTFITNYVRQRFLHVIT